MSRLSFTLANPLDDPQAIAVAGLLLVLLVRLTPLALPLALPLAVLMALGLAMLRARQGRRGDRLRDRRVRESIDGAQQRASQLAVQAELVSVEAMARFQDPSQLEALGMVQLCCERLRGLSERIANRWPLLESGGGILLSVDELQGRLSREREGLRREPSATLRGERERLVDQLVRNLDAARFGMDAREARLLALSTRLEQIDGGLRHLQQKVDAQWPSNEATDAAVTEAIEPLDEALDQIDRLLDAGRDPRSAAAPPEAGASA
jgi:chromosome segregation ATPase